MINSDCSGLYYLSNLDGISTEMIDDREYWTIDGLSNTGGFSTYISLPQTGVSYMPSVTIMAFLVIMLIVRYSNKLQLSS